MTEPTEESAPPQSAFVAIKIKEEKITPASSPTHADPIEDDKKSVEPAKTSNEILAELFQVFGSTSDDFLADLGKKSKKKHKKEKKHKRKKENGDADDSANASKEAKKIKKEKRDKRKDKDKNKEKDKSMDADKSKEPRKVKEKSPIRVKREPAPLLTEGEIKKEKRKGDHLEHHQRRRRRERELKDDDLDILEYEKQLSDQKCAIEMGKTKPAKGKIIIKDLKNSSVFEDAVREKDRERKRRRSSTKANEGELSDTSMKSRNSEISLSDEETYNTERDRYYNREQRDGSYHNRDNYRSERSDRNRSRRYNEAERGNWRGSRRFDDDYSRR